MRLRMGQILIPQDPHSCANCAVPVFWGIFASIICSVASHHSYTYIWLCVEHWEASNQYRIKQSSAWTVTLRSQKQRRTMVQYVYLNLLETAMLALWTPAVFFLTLKLRRDLSWALKVKPDWLSLDFQQPWGALGCLRCSRRVHVPDLEDGWDSWRWLYLQREAQCPSSR